MSPSALTIDSVAEEIDAQPHVLANWNRSHLPKAPRGSLFVGAGDSYAAALSVSYTPSAEFVALDPYVLFASPEVAAGREVFFISVSGRTSSNVSAARRIRGIARNSTAITANEKSPLVRATDDVLVLPFTPSPRTPGTLSFTISLLTALKLSLGRIDCDFDSAFKRAKTDFSSIAFSKDTTYFLGNGPAYPAALYASAKMYELLGNVSHAELLEEFSHLELFSLKKTDTVNIFSCFDPQKVGHRLHRSLSAHGFRSSLIPTHGSSATEMLFHCIFLTQLALVDRARRSRRTKPAFLLSRDRLQVSDSLIY